MRQSDLSAPSPPPVRIETLAQMTARGGWEVDLAHCRAQALLIRITRGQGLALLDGRRRGVGLNNVLYIPPGRLFSLALGRPGFAQVVSWHGPGGPGAPLHLRLRDAVAQNELAILCDALLREQNENRPLAGAACAAHGDLIRIWLRRLRDDDTAQAAAADSPARRLTRAYCQRLAEAAPATSRVADHAAALGITATHLNRVCKAETGRGAAELLAEVTLHAARSALAATAEPVQDIARALGFASPAYFTRFIRRHTGHSPSDLRRLSPSPAAFAAPRQR